MKLFLDDKRDPPDDTWTVVRTAVEAIDAIKACIDGYDRGYRFESMMFDHDLGHCNACEGCSGWRDQCGCRCHWTGYIVVCWMEMEDIWPVNKPTCHSQNPVGKAKIEAAINRKWENR